MTLHKLGRCPPCLRIALLGAIASWISTIVMITLAAPQVVVAVLVGGSVALSVLFAAHVVALAIWLARAMAPAREALRTAGGEAWSDPQFVLLVMRLLVVSLRATLVARTAAEPPTT